MMAVLYRAFKTNTVETSAFTNPWGLESMAVNMTPMVDRIVPFSVVPYRLSLLSRRLAVVSGSPAMEPVVDRFLTDMAARYPAVNFSTFANGAGFSERDASINRIVIPSFSDVVMRFNNSDALKDYIKSRDYANGQGDARPTIWAAITFN